MRRFCGLTVGFEISRVWKPNEAAESIMNWHTFSSPWGCFDHVSELT